MEDIDQVPLAVASAGRPHDQVDWTRCTALIVGGETGGAGKGARQLATEETTSETRRRGTVDHITRDTTR